MRAGVQLCLLVPTAARVDKPRKEEAAGGWALPMVETFEQLGLFAADRQIWLPLFLALSLELGALFGLALLLVRRRP